MRDTTQISFVREDLNSRFWPLTELYLCAFTHAPCSFPRNSPKLFGSGLNGPLIDLKISSSGICPLGPCALFPQPFVNSDESQTRISETELEDQESSLLPLRDEDIWSEDSIRQRHARPVISSKVQQMTSEGFPHKTDVLQTPPTPAFPLFKRRQAQPNRNVFQDAASGHEDVLYNASGQGKASESPDRRLPSTHRSSPTRASN